MTSIEWLVRTALALATVLSGPVALMAQLTTATISGTITDQSGAIVPEARVTAAEISTGAVIRTQASGEGFYVLSGLLPGQYRLRVEKQGFQNYVQEGILVQVNRPVTASVILQVGAAAQTITVTGAADQVNLRSQTVSHEVNTQMVTELPLNGRNILQLMSLAPDAGPASSSGFQQNASRPEGANTYTTASGGRGNSTTFYLDGSINEDALTLIANVFPNPDAIQEFSFQTNTYSAKFGGRGGGVMNAVTRGGTNRFHGALFEFMRNSSLNARNFFAFSQDGLKRNQYGLTVGGPIRRDRTFFFFSFQGTKLRQTPAANSSTTLTAAQRGGDFSTSRTNIVDPETSRPFPNKQVPVSRFSPIALRIISRVPVGTPGSGVVYYVSRTVQNTRQFVTRVDHNMGNKLRIYASYLFDGLTQPPSTLPDNLLTAMADQYWRSQNAVVNATYTFQPNLLGAFVASVSRRLNLYTGVPQSVFPNWTALGAAIPNLVTGGSKNAFNLRINNYFAANWNGYYTIPSTAGNVGTHWTYIKGAHTLELGGEIFKSKVIKNQDFQSGGLFAFTAALSGDNALDFLLSRPSSFTQRQETFHADVLTQPGLYATDAWRIGRRLTLNLGVRWTPFVPIDETAYHQMAAFGFDFYNQGIRSKLFPNLPPGFLVYGDPGIPNRVLNSNYRIFHPRFGFALDPFGDGRTSVRGGYGMYQDQMFANQINPGFSPFSVDATFAFPASMENPYQGRYNPFPVVRPNPSGFLFPLPMAARAFTLGMKPPTIQTWNFTLERQLPWTSLIRVAYEGQEAYHLGATVEVNAAVYNPALSAAANRQAVDARRPMGQYYQGLGLARNEFTSSFNALVVSVEKRATHGLTFLSGYRWSKCLNVADSGFFGSVDFSTPNPRDDRGLCSYDVSNQFRFSYSWRFPTFQSRGLIARNVLGGWETNGIVNVRDGLPFTVVSGIDNSLSGIGKDRADLVGSPSLPSGRSKTEKLQQWFNTKAFTPNALATYGTSARNFLRGPGFANVDFSLVRAFPIRKGPFAEKQEIQFRAEFFNLFNRANFDLPTASATSSTFGRVLSAQDARIIQLGLKFVY